MEHHYLNIFLELPDKCFLAHCKVSEILQQCGTLYMPTFTYIFIAASVGKWTWIYMFPNIYKCISVQKGFTQTQPLDLCKSSRYSSFSSCQHDHAALLWSILSAAAMYRHQRHTRCHHDHKSLPCECFFHPSTHNSFSLPLSFFFLSPAHHIGRS